MTALGTRLLAVRELGASALLPYAAYRLGLSLGWIARRTPASWQDRPAEAWIREGIPTGTESYADYRSNIVEPRFFFPASVRGLPWDATTFGPPAAEADEVLAGRFRLFGGPPIELGFPPDWLAFPPPLSEKPGWTAVDHWTRVRLDEDGRDARLVWELSRFGWVYPLARAYRATGEAKYADACWALIEDWRRANPPNCGVHWASAQEVGLRLLAMAFAERAFFPEWRVHAGRLLALTRWVGLHAARLPPTLDYARAQNNNHVLSEAAGLFTAGVLFPELRQAQHWSSLGRRLLEAGFRRQVFDDGGYIQHSSTYQRLALALGVWTCRLAELSGESFSRSTLDAVGRLSRSVAIQADSESGRTPTLGPDDGSEMFRLTSGDAGDVRPGVTAGARLAFGETWYPPGPWDELSLWLGLQPGTRAPMPRSPSLPRTGLHFLEGGGARGRLRCVEFRERPGHSDQLHVDIWQHGQSLAIDPGSYLYNGPFPWRDGLAGTDVHNAPRIDGQEPMRRAGRFLWAERAHGRLTGRWTDGRMQVVRGEHDGYRRLGVTVSRALALIDEDAWLVIDEARGTGNHRLTVGWNLTDGAWEWSSGELRVTTKTGVLRLGWDREGTRAGLARAGAWVAGQSVDGPLERWGWMSPGYSVLEPCLRLVLELQGDLPLVLRSWLSASAVLPETLEHLWERRARLEPPASPKGTGE